MQKFLRTLMLTAALLLPFASNAQTSWTVADGTTLHSKVPLDFYNCDGSGNRQAQMLYPASLLTEMSGSTIGTVKLYHQNTTSKTVTASTWYLRMGETTETDLSSGLSSETLTTVYSGNLVVEGGVMTFEFTTPYTYNGGNLIVEIQTSGASQNWYGSSNQGCYGVDNIGSTYSTMSTPNYTAFVPKITFYEQPSCFKVNDLDIDATQTTSSSLTLTWTDANNSGASYDIYTITPADTTLIGSSTTTTYTATGLDANTAYVFGVASNCGGGDLAELRIVSGRTACAAIATLPYTMGFEDADLQGTSYAELFPFCWTRINTLASGTYTYYPYAYNYGTPYNGGRHLYFTASSYGTYADTTGFIMPELDVTTYPMNGNRVTFWARASSSSYPYTVLVGTMTDPTDRSTFTLVESVSVTATSYTKYAVSLATAAATDAYVAFIVPKVTSTMYIDDVTLEELPSCGDVTGLTVAGTTSSTATLRWNTVAGAMGYTVYNMADSSVLGTATDTTYTVEDLDANTVYTFGVQSNCAGGDGVMATASGRTACAAETMPWSQDFASSLSSDPCWRGASNITADSAFNGGALTLGSFNTWSHVTSPRCGLEGGHYYKNVYGTGVKHWMITPAIDLTTATSAQLSFDVALTDFNNATLPEENADTNTSQALMVIVSTDGGATWQRSNATVWQNVEGANYTYASLASTTYQTKVINLDQYLGQTINIAFYCQSLWAGGDNDLHLDNIAVTEVPDCPAPANIVVSNLTGHTATLTWEGDADGYTVYDMSDTSVYQYANDTTIELYALSGETAYTFGVTSNCGSDESEMVTISFTTPISCPVPTDLAAALTPGDGTVATLSWHEAGEASEWQLCLNGDMTNLVTVYDTTYDMTNLTPEQAITAKVRAICGADDTSAWSAEISFTPTNAYTLTVNDGTATNSYVPVYGLYTDDHIKSQFIIPAADLSAMAYGNITKLTFYSSDANKNWGAASFEVYMTETNETTVNSLASVSDMTQVYTGSLGIANNVMEITLTTPYQYMGGNLMIAFEQPTSGTWGGCNWYGVDATGASQGGHGSSVSQRNFLPKTTFDFTPGEAPSCLPVSNLAVSDITTDGATLSWTGDASSYNVYVISGSDTTIDQNVSDVTVTLTGLTPMTQYTYGVRSACGGDESDIRVVTFNTACAAVTLPYTETFASTSATRNCWNLVSNNTANVGASNGMGFVTVSGRETMRFSSFSNASDYNQYGFSPLMEISDDATYLQAKVVYATYGSSDKLKFGYITATDTVWDPTEYTTTGDSDWQSQTFVVPVTATQLAVHYYGNFSYYGWIDSVEVVEMTGAYCAPVTSLTVDSTTGSSVTLSWNGDAASYSIYNGSAYVGNTTGNTYTVSGLTASTGYTFGVTAVCTATDSSDMVTVDAMTDCAGGSCTITIVGTDDYGDGWDGSYIDIRQNGASVAHCTVEGEYDPWGDSYPVTETFTYNVCAGIPVSFVWVNGGGIYDDEAYFTIQNANGTVLYSVDDASELTIGAPFVTLSDACSDSVVIVPDTLTVTIVADATMGTTVPAPGTYQYITGDTVRFQAVPNNGYHFSGWIMSANGQNDTLGAEYISAYVPANAIMSYGSMTLTALFEAGNPDSTTITYAVNDATMGTTVPAPGTHTIYVGNTIQAEATANAGYELYAWVLSIAVGSNNNTDTIYSDDEDFANPMIFGTLPQSIVDNNATITITALFQASTIVDGYTVTVNVNDAAMGHVEGAPTAAVAENTVVTLTAVANNGYRFVNWSNGLTNDTISITVVSDTTLTANFEAIPTYTVTTNVAPENSGSVNGAPAAAVLEGTVLTLTAVPAAGYHFVNWSNGLTDVTISVTVMSDTTLTANFEANAADTYTVAVNFDATMGSVTGVPTDAVTSGTEVTLTAVANDGYHFVDWSTGETTETITITVTSDTTITANFEADAVEMYTVTVTSDDETMGTVTGSGEYEAGAQITIEAHANTGYRFVRWSDGNTEALRQIVVTSDLTLVAYFEQVTGIDDVEGDNVSIYSAESRIVVKGAENSNIYVYDVNGRVVRTQANATETVEFTVPGTGVYLVKVGNAPAKRVVVVR